MKIYRHSPLHSEKVGRMLAGLLHLITRASRNQKMVKEVDGVVFELDLNQVIDASLYYSGTFENDIEHLITLFLKPGMVVIDVGANIGYHTFRMARLVTETGSVYAIEPTQHAFAKLLRNADLNPEIKNVRFLKLALNNDDLGIIPASFESSYRLDNIKDSNIEMIEFLTLDSLCEREHIPPVNFIKIDVDGFEAKIINGCQRMLSRKPSPVLLMEINPSSMAQNGDDLDEMIGIFAGLGYAFQTVDGVPIHDLKSFCRQRWEASTMVVGMVSTDLPAYYSQ